MFYNKFSFAFHRQAYPLSEEHWLNQPLTSEDPRLSDQLLLQASVSQERPEFTRLLVRAGARANAFNPQLNQVIGVFYAEARGERAPSPLPGQGPRNSTS